VYICQSQIAEFGQSCRDFFQENVSALLGVLHINNFKILTCPHITKFQLLSAYFVTFFAFDILFGHLEYEGVP
jgi:hypothetical protein